MSQKISKKILLGCLTIVAPLLTFSQGATDATPVSSGGVDINMVLLIVSAFLLIPIYITGKAFTMVVNEYVRKSRASGMAKKAGALLLLLCAFHFTQAQTTTTDTTASSISWVLLAVIIVETGVIIFLSWMINKFLRAFAAREAAESGMPSPYGESWFKTFWDKINSFKPMEEEASIDTGHSYDGIRELDNVTPPWFITAFTLTIIFAIIYLYRYHVSKSAPLQTEEYNIEVADYEAAKAKAPVVANSVDETNVKMLGADEIAKGKALFTLKCTPCHGPDGGSKPPPAGIGPNLTDDYWIHGGSLQSVFKSIKYGWPEKGMITWKEQLTAQQIAELACFVKSIHGTNPPGARAPQGDLYKEESAVKADSTAQDTAKKADAVKVKVK